MAFHPYTRLFVLPAPPDANDDASEGFEPGDVVHVTGGSVYDCRDNAEGAAVWEERSTAGVSIDHGSLTGLSDNDHPQYIRHNLASAIGDFLIASAPGTFVKQTGAQAALYLSSFFNSLYAPIAKGVTNGDTHDHVGGDGAALYTYDEIKAFCNGAVVGAGLTRYAAPLKNTVDTTQNQVPVLKGGVAMGLAIRVSLTQPASGTMTVTLAVNGTPTSMVATVPAGVTGGTHLEISPTTVVMADNDTVRWDVVNNAGANSASITAIAMLIKRPIGT